MTEDLVVTIVHRDSTGQEDLLRLRTRENKRGTAPAAPAIMAPEAKRRIMELVTALDAHGVVRAKLKEFSNPDVYQLAGKVILRPLQIKARKIPTSCTVEHLPDGLGDQVPPLCFTREARLSLDTVAEALVSFGIRRSEAQFLVLYVSDVVDDAEASGASKAISVSLDAVSVVARVERTPSTDKDPDQLRVLIVLADHAAPKTPARRPAQSASASAA
jgi:hypothetical protein